MHEMNLGLHWSLQCPVGEETKNMQSHCLIWRTSKLPVISRSVQFHQLISNLMQQNATRWTRLRGWNSFIHWIQHMCRHKKPTKAGAVFFRWPQFVEITILDLHPAQEQSANYNWKKDVAIPNLDYSEFDGFHCSIQSHQTLGHYRGQRRRPRPKQQ